MKSSGWIFMIVSWAFIIWLILFSYVNLLRKSRKRKRPSAGWVRILLP